MSVFNYIVGKLKSGIITFVNMVTLSHRDWPFHDYATFRQVEEDPARRFNYAVGTNQVAAHGSQTKLFVSKSTLIMCTGNCHLRFNDGSNVVLFILANNWYEFKSNIYAVHILGMADNSTIRMYFEGVLPEEQRSAI